MKKLRILFMGTPDFSLPSLAALHQSEQEVVAVFTRPPKRQGRGKTLTPSPVATYCQQQELPCFGFDQVDQAFLDQLEALKPDLIVVVAFGLILTEQVLAIPRFGCLNLHGSLLPKWRGAAPIERALLAGDLTSGVTLMKMSSGMDEGAIIASKELALDYAASLQENRDTFARAGAALLVSLLPQIDSLPSRPQAHHLASYAPKVTKEELALDWRLPAAYLWRLILVGEGKAWCLVDEKRLLVHQAQVLVGTAEPGEKCGQLTFGTGRGLLQLTVVQKPGGKPQPSWRGKKH